MIRLRALAVALGLLLFGASCSHSGSAELIDPPPLADVGGDDRPVTLPFEGVDIGGEVFRLALKKPESIDPAKVSLVDQSAVIVADLVYDGLVEAVGTEGRLRPQLATQWEHAGNFSNWTFTLDTARVTPESVKASFERLVASSPDSAAVAMLDEVFGVAEVRAGFLSEISGITVVDQSTVAIRLVRPDAGFPWLISGVNYSIVGPDAAPTGMYSIGADNGSTLWLTSDVMSDIAVTWTTSDEVAQQILEEGLVDGAVVQDDTNGQPRSIVRFFGLNALAPDLGSVDTRRAVIAAIDSNNLLPETESALLPVDGAAVSSMAGWQADACAASCAYDPEAAKARLSEIGGNVELTVGIVGENDEAIAEAIAEDLREVGFTIEVVKYSAADLAEAISAGEAEIFAFGWAAPGHSVDSVVDSLFNTRSELNVVRFSGSDVDELLAGASGLADDTLRWALLQQAHTKALKNAIMLPVGAARNRLILVNAESNFAVRADGSLEVNADR